MNARHASGATSIDPAARSVVSRTSTLRGVVAVSTHPPPLVPL